MKTIAAITCFVTALMWGAAALSAIDAGVVNWAVVTGGLLGAIMLVAGIVVATDRRHA